MNALTFAHVSDLHLPFEPRLGWRQRFSKRQLSAWSWRRRRAVQRPEILDALRAELRARRPDHVVVTGDITNFSLPGEFAQAAQWLAELAPPGRLSAVPGNHDALVAMPYAQGLGRLGAYMATEDGWPYVRYGGSVAFIGLKTALPTAPLLASGRLGTRQLERLGQLLHEEAAAGRTRVVLLHHPPVDGAVSRRKALADRAALRAVLRQAGAELVLHGHARGARLEAVPGPHGPIPVLCVPSSSALPNPRDEAARWHLVTLSGGAQWARVAVRQWSVAAKGFVDAATYELRLPDRG
ncbi:MAG TPA: metallophosphoesterase [Steroidobacteraceae bacterium]|nr:metallophosphoesterase [Steroidobacteraceae bacterium]